MNRLFQFLHKVLESSNMPTRRPVLRANFESNIAGVYIIGDLAGAKPVDVGRAGPALLRRALLGEGRTGREQR